MKNGLENGYYHEITPSGFGIAIKAGKLLYSKQSEFQKVEVFETESSLGRVLTLDNLMMTTEGDEFHYHEMISHVPMMHHPNPKTVLVIGGGDGGTIREVLKHETVEKAVLCEIDGLVIEACKEHLPTIACELDNPKCEILVEDAIEYIKDKVDMFDVVLIDSTDPMGPGEGLFTEEFYTNVKRSLKKGGIVAAQSESPFVNKEEIKKCIIFLKKCSQFAQHSHQISQHILVDTGLGHSVQKKLLHFLTTQKIVQKKLQNLVKSITKIITMQGLHYQTI